MSNQLVILEAMPSAADFYGLYWGKKPFVVAGAIAENIFEGVIAADELAGLSMEQAPMSRMVKTPGPGRTWSCDFGPFTEQDFKDAGDQGWSLLVQNVDQFHPDTAALLDHFNFAPRWLMDDIMVSYSSPGGSVGPHIDSYHVFLVQGEGRRRWKIANRETTRETYLEGLELKVLEDDYDGDEIEVSCGDVLYLPPKFAHQGTTLEASLTYSVGFLGPKLSELFGGYANYLAEHEELDQRYAGQGLDPDSAGLTLGANVTGTVQAILADQLGKMDFGRWLVEYFAEIGHEDFGHYNERETPLACADFTARLSGGATLYKPHYVKFVVAQSSPETCLLAFEGQSFTFARAQLPLWRALSREQRLDAQNTPELLHHGASVELLCTLYNHQGLELG